MMYLWWREEGGGVEAYLWSSQGCLLQVMAALSREASEARVALLNMLQAKFHSSTPPSAMALQ